MKGHLEKTHNYDRLVDAGGRWGGDGEGEKVTWGGEASVRKKGRPGSWLWWHKYAMCSNSSVPREKELCYSKLLGWIVHITPWLLGGTGPVFVFLPDMGSAFLFLKNSLVSKHGSDRLMGKHSKKKGDTHEHLPTRGSVC